ncbi:M23 family metallopeptidase [Streptomyces sp. UNOC14_S4]|uniref:M23 family metallopeptidase n=1 Tax=Streptomyces sp. UNOC14_S4 TaxID=2872340 RepID=UPI001E5760F3|nr:M23 family metallopeptidase [Streptomyces sp. UNOC14_S4]MCC3771000.1 M23 family metallopeptidase [Streptomyces sp. UNOC14_S4]
MSKHATFRSTSASLLRTRVAALVAAGIGASLVLGTSVALADDASWHHHRHPVLASVTALGGALHHTRGSTRLRAHAGQEAGQTHAKHQVGQAHAKQEAGQAHARRQVGQAHAKQEAGQARARRQAGQARAKQEAVRRAAEARRAVVASRQRADAWVAPVEDYTIGQPFGISGPLWAYKHSGQDLVVNTGTPVKAVHRGTIVKAGPHGGGDGAAYGNAVVIKHDDNTYSQYAHLSHIAVRVGQMVMTGERIGLSGSTGNSTGPHLHFEIRTTPDYGSAVEPRAFLSAHGEDL